MKQRASVGDREIQEGKGRDSETEKNGAARELCTKLEQVGVRNWILLSTYCVPGPESNTSHFFYAAILTTFRGGRCYFTERKFRLRKLRNSGA